MTTPTASATPGAKLLNPTDHLLVMIDFQSQMAFATHSIPIIELRNNASLVAQAAAGFKVPTILTTVAEKSFSGPMFDEVTAPFGGQKMLDRTSMNTWEDVAVIQEVNRIAKKRIVIDPGFGFGKDTTHNLALLAQLERFGDLGVPVLAGLSRKRTIGELTGRDIPRERVHGSVAAHLIAAQRGARLLRVHDVAATVDALKVWNAVASQPQPRQSPASPAILWPDDE